MRFRSVPLGRWPALGLDVLRAAGRDRVTMIGGSLAFHGFLALVPVLIAAVALFGLVGLSPSTLHDVLHDTSTLLPAQMSQLVNQQLTRPASKASNVVEVAVGLAIAVWSSIEAMSALQIGLDVAYEIPHDRGFLGRRLHAIPLIAVTLVLGGTASVLLVLGTPLERLLPSAFALLRPEYRLLLLLVRYGGALVLLMVLLSVFYAFGTSGPYQRWEWISPGSAVASLGWALAAAGFSYYLDHFAHESRSYGALAGVAVTLLWMFLTSLAVLLGAELNRRLQRLAEQEEHRVGSGPTDAGRVQRLIRRRPRAAAAAVDGGLGARTANPPVPAQSARRRSR